MLKFSANLHITSHVDSALASTREYWRRRLGLPEYVVIDQRKLADIIAASAKRESE